MIEPLSVSTKPRLASKARLRYDQLRGVDLLLLPERVVKLTPTAAAILNLCDGARTIAEIVSELERRYLGTNLQGDVLEFLERMSAEGWIH